MDLSGIVMQRCRLRGARFNGATVRMGNLSNCDLRDASFSLCNLQGTSLSGCDLTNADFESANLSAIDVRDPSGDLTGRRQMVDFSNAVLTGAKFADTDVSDVDLTGTILAQGPKSI